MNGLELAKNRLRGEIKTRLASLSAAERGEKSRILCARIAAADFWPALSTVAAFVPLPGEPDIRPLLEQALAEGKRLLLPRMDKGTLVFHAVGDLTQDLLPHAYGMAEPSPRLPCADWEAALGESVLFLVPGLAFDSRGGRLGRGGGFYDRFLHSLPAGFAPRILGAAFSCQLVESVPAGAGDFFLHGLVTEEQPPLPL